MTHPPVDLEWEMLTPPKQKISLTNHNFLIQKFSTSVGPVSVGSVGHLKRWCSKYGLYPRQFKSGIKLFSILDLAHISYYVSKINAGFLGPHPKVTMGEHISEATDPILLVELAVPVETLGAVAGDISKRKGGIIDNDQEGDDSVITVHVSLNTMFGYSTVFHSMTQG